MIHAQIAHEKLQRLEMILRDLRSVVVAYSGGVDSTFVLKAAVEALGGERVLAVTSISPSVPQRDRDDAAKFARQIGAPHLTIHTQEVEDPRYAANPTNRCYFCKSELYTQLEKVRAERKLAAIVSGTNADDLGDYRPGLTAADERGVRAPLAEAGLTKDEIRALSREMGLEAFDKPASPCLSSRVPYGEAITPEKLRMIEAAESALRAMGLADCRVRHHGALARIEVAADEIARLAHPEVRARIDAALRAVGYQYVTLDLRGFRSGSLNEVIAFGQRQSI